MPESCDIVVVGAGAAGLITSIFAARTRPGRRIIIVDGAKTLGAKILVAGGGRCNVTHDVVDETAYAGSSRHAIKKVLRRFGADATVAFFRELGVELKREDTGKLFPVTDDARTVLNALLSHARELGILINHPRRVSSVRRADAPTSPSASLSIDTQPLFHVEGDWGIIATPRVVLATGGKSLPKSGSDGQGFEIARTLGHSITPRVFPALVPLLLSPDHMVCSLSGIALEAELQVRSATGKKLVSFTGSTLCTHFGLSGPCPLDISRYFLDAVADDPGAALVANWLPGETFDHLDAAFTTARGSVGNLLKGRVPARFAEAIVTHARLDPARPMQGVPRDARRTLVRSLVEMNLPVTGSRGFTYAEVTAGGVPLDELHLNTMESRLCPGLHLCGEICDVDGRIGGYNFQWAWSSGYTAGVSV